MTGLDDLETDSHEIFGFVGLALAVLGIIEVPPVLRYPCLLGASVCLAISFSRQEHWPLWCRWLLALLANSFLAFVGWSVFRRG